PDAEESSPVSLVFLAVGGLGDDRLFAGAVHTGIDRVEHAADEMRPERDGHADLLAQFQQAVEREIRPRAGAIEETFQFGHDLRFLLAGYERRWRTAAVDQAGGRRCRCRSGGRTIREI